MRPPTPTHIHPDSSASTNTQPKKKLTLPHTSPGPDITNHTHPHLAKNVTLIHIQPRNVALTHTHPHPAKTCHTHPLTHIQPKNVALTHPYQLSKKDQTHRHPLTPGHTKPHSIKERPHLFIFTQRRSRSRKMKEELKN